VCETHNLVDTPINIGPGRSASAPHHHYHPDPHPKVHPKEYGGYEGGTWVASRVSGSINSNVPTQYKLYIYIYNIHRAKAATLAILILGKNLASRMESRRADEQEIKLPGIR